MAMISNFMKGLFVSGLIVGTLAACDDGDVTDATDAATTAETTEGTTAPPPPFAPYQVAMDSSVGFKASTEEGKFGSVVPWSVDGESTPTSIDIIIYDERFEATQNIEFVCSLKLVASSAPDGHYIDFKFNLGSGEVDYHHFGYTMKSGAFTVENAPFQTQAGEIAGCLDKNFDAMVWGDDFGALFAEQDWGLSWGDMAAEISKNFDATEDDPDNDWDTYDLYNGGYIIGGSNQASAYVGTGPIFYTYGYAADSEMALIPTEDEANPYERLLGNEMIPPEDGKPLSGVMQVRGAYIWFAKPLLLGVQQ
ncbi:MAG: hypothetical protein ACI9MC_000601 [Kiritimatiellia bacterium]|jgi:hypothetical protein